MSENGSKENASRDDRKQATSACRITTRETWRGSGKSASVPCRKPARSEMEFVRLRWFGGVVLALALSSRASGTFSSFPHGLGARQVSLDLIEFMEKIGGVLTGLLKTGANRGREARPQRLQFLYASLGERLTLTGI